MVYIIYPSLLASLLKKPCFLVVGATVVVVVVVAGFLVVPASLPANLLKKPGFLVVALVVVGGFLVVLLTEGGLLVVLPIDELIVFLPPATSETLQLLNLLMQESLLQAPVNANFPQSYLAVLSRSNLRM